MNHIDRLLKARHDLDTANSGLREAVDNLAREIRKAHPTITREGIGQIVGLTQQRVSQILYGQSKTGDGE